MRYTVTIDVPNLEEGVRFYSSAFGFAEISRPVPNYAILKSGDFELGVMEKPPGSKPARNADDVRRYERHWTPVHMDFHTDDFAAALKRTEEAGAVIEERHEGGNHSNVAFCCDPFGNGFCIIGKKPNA